jgi:hypothetical protein
MPQPKHIQKTKILIGDQREVVFDGPIHPHWQAAAVAKGFKIEARVADRYHLALCCDECDGLTKTRLSVLMSAQPICAPCLAAKHAEAARMAGLKFLGRDASDRHYAFYQAKCGHTMSRQFALIERAAAGEAGVRCEECLHAKHASEAEEQGWTLVGADPANRTSYRLYQHQKCGADQSIAVGNMNTGRFDCSHCGETWSAAKSNIYMMRFDLACGETVLKLGYSRNPNSRLRHQLQTGPRRDGELLRAIAVSSGRTAIIEEKAMHKRLRTELGHTLVSPVRFTDQLKVKSEIYTLEALDLMTSLLDDLASRQAG